MDVETEREATVHGGLRRRARDAGIAEHARNICGHVALFPTVVLLVLAILASAPVAGAFPAADLPAPSRQAIHAAIDDHTQIPFTADATDAWDVLSMADDDPADQAIGVRGLYDNALWPASSSGTDAEWNREHVWPRSRGVGEPSNSRTACTSAANDLHNLFASAEKLNSARGNLLFDDCIDRDCTEKPLLDGSSSLDGSNRLNWMRGGDEEVGKWEVWAETRTVIVQGQRRRVVASGGRRGDVARAIFYMDVRYEGGTHGITNCPEPDLLVTDDLTLPPDSGGLGPGPELRMAQLTTLVRWHFQDPPDARERHRNNVVEQFQRNRNPFIDHPAWVCALWPVPCGNTGRVLWLPLVAND